MRPRQLLTLRRTTWFRIPSAKSFHTALCSPLPTACTASWTAPGELVSLFRWDIHFNPVGDKFPSFSTLVLPCAWCGTHTPASVTHSNVFTLDNSSQFEFICCQVNKLANIIKQINWKCQVVYPVRPPRTYFYFIVIWQYHGSGVPAVRVHPLLWQKPDGQSCEVLVSLYIHICAENQT